MEIHQNQKIKYIILLLTIGKIGKRKHRTKIEKVLKQTCFDQSFCFSAVLCNFFLHWDV